jgi:hypothetical protein
MAIKIKDVWVKGDLKALSTFDETYLSTGSRQVNDISLSHIEISNAVILDQFDPQLERKDPYIEYSSIISDVKIRFKGASHDEVAFSEDLDWMLLNDIVFFQKIHLNDVDNHVINGTVFFKRRIKITVPDPPNLKVSRTQVILNNQFGGRPIVREEVIKPVVNEVRFRPVNKRLQSFFATEKKNFLGSLFVIALLLILFYNTSFFPLIFIAGIVYLVWSFKKLSVGYSNLTPNQGDDGGSPVDIYKPKSTVKDQSWSPFSKFILFILVLLILFALGAKNYGLLKFLGIVAFIWFLLNYFTSGFGLLKKVFNLIGGLILGLLGLMALWFILGGNNTSVADDSQKEDFIKNNKILKTGDSLLHFRNWKDYNVQQLSGKYFTFYPEFDKAAKFRNDYESNDFSAVYQSLVDKDAKIVEVYAKLFDSLNTANKWNRQQLAEAVVTSIQTIPYVLVHDQSCQQAIKESGSSFLIQYHKDGKECLPDIKYGVQGGYEFLHNLKGDCDTRSLLCFEILSRFKFPVAMLISEEYGHCILGIDLPLKGKSVGNYQHNYLVWETTAPGFKPGELSPEISDMDKWHIAITN